MNGLGGPRSRLKRWRRCRATGRVGSSLSAGLRASAPVGRPLKCGSAGRRLLIDPLPAARALPRRQAAWRPIEPAVESGRGLGVNVAKGRFVCKPAGCSALTQAARRRKTRDALVPPNPKELERTVSMVALSCFVRDKIDGGRYRGIVEIERGGCNIVPDGKHGKDGLDRTRCPKQMPRRRLRRRHGEFARGVPEQPLHGAKLDLVTHRRRSAVCIDVVDLAGANAGSRQRQRACSDRPRRRSPRVR